MPELEQVMRGLKLCNLGKLSDCETCPYSPFFQDSQCSKMLCGDALALLREQEPRVMTKEEIIQYSEWVWVEYTSDYQGWNKVDEYDAEYDAICWNDTTMDMVDDYGHRWRCWTSRPTDEQRKNTPWR